MKRGLFIAASFAAIAVLEELRPLRKRVERKDVHVTRDIAIAALAGLATALINQRFVDPVATSVERRRQGLLRRGRFPRAIRVVAGVLLLDYSLWIWHYLNHRTDLLWRMHRAHHVDLDLDVWTAVRFHFAEMSLAGFVRLLQIRLIGPDPLALTIWQTLLLPSIFFHHSSIRLPWALERALSRVIVTPRMHTIHHSTVKSETNSNWSSLLTVWDRLHGTFILDERDVTIGVPAYQAVEDVTLPKVLAMPVKPTAGDWDN
jgi:sterol desaturase/sphingolipid hydroxylase (fatty acid hydroxylase superfamily)